jgi:hypothetical protein
LAREKRSSYVFSFLHVALVDPRVSETALALPLVSGFECRPDTKFEAAHVDLLHLSIGHHCKRLEVLDRVFG